MIRESLLKILEDEAVHVVGDVASGEEALRLIRAQEPQVAIVDVSMPAPDGIALTEMIKAERLPTKVLILTMHSEAALVRRALKAGALGVVLKDDAVDDLRYAIRTVANGGTYLSPALAAAVTLSPSTSSLSERELAVLGGVADGETSKEIAARLGLSAKTVDTYRARAAQKLGVRNGPELVRAAMLQGLLERR